MTRSKVTAWLFFALLPVLAACEQTDAPAPRAVRACVALTPAPGEGADIGPAYAHARERFGLREPGDINFNWNAIEPAPGQLTDPGGELARQAALFADAESLTLTLAPIQTLEDARPSDLQGTPFDAPVMVERYVAALREMARHFPPEKIRVVSVGNEVDARLTTPAELEAYRAFFGGVKRALAAEMPGVKLGVKLTWASIVADDAPAALRAIIADSDVVIATYYPLADDFTVRDPGVVAADLDALLAVAGGTEVFLAEAGYPSGAESGSSLEQQAQFMENLTAYWGAHDTQMPTVCVTWLNDLSDEVVDAVVDPFGLDDPAFRSFIATLGIRDTAGTDKPAHAVLERFFRNAE